MSTLAANGLMADCDNSSRDYPKADMDDVTSTLNFQLRDHLKKSKFQKHFD